MQTVVIAGADYEYQGRFHVGATWLRKKISNNITVVLAWKYGATGVALMLFYLLYLKRQPLLIVYTGHGSTFGWALHTFSLLPYAIIALLVKYSPSSVVIVSHCCHSGGLVRRMNRYKVDPEKVFVVCGCKEDEVDYGSAPTRNDLDEDEIPRVVTDLVSFLSEVTDQMARGYWLFVVEAYIDLDDSMQCWEFESVPRWHEYVFFGSSTILSSYKISAKSDPVP